MTAHTLITAAFTSRGLLSSDGQCRCAKCGTSGMDREEMAGDEHYANATTRESLEHHHGGPLCWPCADELYRAVCAYCGVIDKIDGHVTENCCTDCDAEATDYAGENRFYV